MAGMRGISALGAFRARGRDNVLGISAGGRGDFWGVILGLMTGRRVRARGDVR